MKKHLNKLAPSCPEVRGDFVDFDGLEIRLMIGGVPEHFKVLDEKLRERAAKIPKGHDCFLLLSPHERVVKGITVWGRPPVFRWPSDEPPPPPAPEVDWDNF